MLIHVSKRGPWWEESSIPTLTLLCTSSTGFGISDASRIFLELMRRLGHTQFYVQGGDYGAVISTTMAQIYPEYVYIGYCISRNTYIRFCLPRTCYVCIRNSRRWRQRINSLAQIITFRLLVMIADSGISYEISFRLICWMINQHWFRLRFVTVRRFVTP